MFTMWSKKLLLPLCYLASFACCPISDHAMLLKKSFFQISLFPGVHEPIVSDSNKDNLSEIRSRSEMGDLLSNWKLAFWNM